MLQHHFNGQAAELIQAAKQSAVTLLQLVTAHLPGFRDHAIYKGRQGWGLANAECIRLSALLNVVWPEYNVTVCQAGMQRSKCIPLAHQLLFSCLQVFFYKRAQIFIGDLYGAFGGQGLGHFHDIGQLTMFAGACTCSVGLCEWLSNVDRLVTNECRHQHVILQHVCLTYAWHCVFVFGLHADYRVPVVLRLMGVLQYSQQLADKVQRG